MPRAEPRRAPRVTRGRRHEERSRSSSSGRRSRSCWRSSRPEGCLLVCSLLIMAMVGLKTAMAATHNTDGANPASWLVRSRQLFRQRASPEEDEPEPFEARERALQARAEREGRSARRAPIDDRGQPSDRGENARGKEDEREGRREAPERRKEPEEQQRTRRGHAQSSTRSGHAQSHRATGQQQQASRGQAVRGQHAKTAVEQQPQYQYEEHHATLHAEAMAGGGHAVARRARSSSSRGSAEVVPPELVADMYGMGDSEEVSDDPATEIRHLGLRGGSIEAVENAEVQGEAEAVDGGDELEQMHGSHGVDAILEEAVQSLPQELPFQQV